MWLVNTNIINYPPSNTYEVIFHNNIFETSNICIIIMFYFLLHFRY